jgi:peptide-O-fucosyltransferase
VPFSDVFELDPVREYHRIIPLHDFMAQLAPTYWPPGNRTGFCYGPIRGYEDMVDCQMKHGNPFGPFWDEFSVEFDRSEFTFTSYQVQHKSILDSWIEK